MSVFIHIKSAEIIDEAIVADQVGLKIRSRDTQLTVSPVSALPEALFDCSLISSIKENRLEFILHLENLYGSSTQILNADLSFSTLYFQPEKETSQILSFENKAKLSLDIFFTRKKNFLGPIEFYEYENVSTSSIILHENAQSKQNKDYPDTISEGAKLKAVPFRNSNVSENAQRLEAGRSKKEVISTGGVFFCCGDNNEERNFEVEEIEQRNYGKNNTTKAETSFPLELGQEPKKVQFYQGACQSKNMFSMCDAGVVDNKFTVVEDYYRDRQP